MDEGYCFFAQRNIDWDSIYTAYKADIYPEMSNAELFSTLSEMISVLRDGHVNLVGDNDRTSYWDWFDDYPRNFNYGIIRSYLGMPYTLADEIEYTILDDNVGYIYYANFTSDVTTKSMDVMIKMLERCKGLIVDVRQNGGGNISNARRLNERFAAEKVLTGYICHKTGKGHKDFSTPAPIYIEPAKNVRWEKQVVVLTNRHTYSAANDFVNNMRYLPNVTIMGGITGGGSGLPFSSELPNGWFVRFSASPHFDAEMNHIEFGIEPDIEVNLEPEDEKKGIDTIIEAARKHILANAE